MTGPSTSLPPGPEDQLDILLRDLSDVTVPDGLRNNILSAAPEQTLPPIRRPAFWNRFLKPVFAGPGLAAAMVVGATVGYASASPVEEQETVYDFAFTDDTVWLDTLADEVTE